MKRCKNGHVCNDDNLSFCTLCGEPLEEVEEKVSQIQEKKPTTKVWGCLKKVIIAIVVFHAGLFVLYYYINNAATYLRLEPDNIQVRKFGDAACKIDIDYDGYMWHVNHAPDWVSVKDEEEKCFYLKVEPNRSGQTREGTITVQSGKLVTQLNIQQLGVATVISVSSDNIVFDREGGTQTVLVISDGFDWHLKVPDWLTVSEDSIVKLKIECPENKGNYRNGSIIVYEDNVSYTIRVQQAGKCYSCNGEGCFTCRSCLGSGQIGFGVYTSPCYTCGSTGKVMCSTCGGNGYIN
jgi:hypothetical protein